MSGHIYDEHMADPARRAQASLARGHLAHELVGVQAALHQQLALGFVNQRHRLRRGRLAVRGVDELEAIDIDPMLAGHGGNLPGRTDQDRNDDASFGCLDEPAQGRLVAGMSDDGCRRRDFFRIGDQPLILRGRRAAERARCCDRANRDVSEHLRSPVPARCPRPIWARPNKTLAWRWAPAEGTSARLGAAGEPASTPKSRATSFIRFLSSAENSPRAPSACPTSSNAASRVCLSGGSIAGIAARASFWSTSSMLNCARTSDLNTDKGMSPCAWRIRRTASKPRSSTEARAMPT